MCQLTSEPAAVLPSNPHKYWIIHGQVYDLEAYIKNHPGGQDAILHGRGRDCTEMFEQYHVLSNKHLMVLDKYRVVLPPVGKAALNDLKAHGLEGLPDAEPVEAQPARTAYQVDPFYEDIKTMVRAHGNTKMSYAFVILHCLHVIGLVYGWKLWWEGAYSTAVVLPYFLWVFGAAMVHDGGHFALSRTPAVNKYLNLVLALVTNSSPCWFLQHNILHHSFTNLAGKDGDLDAHHPYMRIHPEQTIPPTTVHHVFRCLTHLGMYTFAHIGMTMIAPLSYFRGLMAQRAGTLKDAKGQQDLQFLKHFHPTIVLQVVSVLTFYIVPFIRFSFWHAAWMTFGSTTLMSIAFMVFAQVSHIQLDAEAPTEDLEKLHWARRMVLTSVDYGQSSYLWCYLSIGLNMQSLHHILPGVSYTQLPALYPKYRAICEKHGIKVLERRSLWHALCTHVETLWVLSKTHSFTQVARKLA